MKILIFVFIFISLHSCSRGKGTAVQLSPIQSGATQISITSLIFPYDDVYVTGQNLDFTVIFNGNVEVTGTEIQFEISGSNKIATYLSGSGTSQITYRYQVQAGDVDVSGITMLSSEIVLNNGNMSCGQDCTVDKSYTPVLSSSVIVNPSSTANLIAINLPPDDTYISGENLDFVIDFDQAVTVTGSQITINMGGVDRSATYLSGSGTSSITYRYTIDSSDSDSDGITLTEGYITGGTLSCGALCGVDRSFTPVNASNILVNQNVTATISSVNLPSNGAYSTGNNLDFIVNFDRNVTVTGSELTIDVGGSPVTASYFSGSGGTAITYRYTIGSGDKDNDGLTISNNSINGGTLSCGYPCTVSRTFTAVTDTEIYVNPDSIPSITAISTPYSNYTDGQDIDFTVNFDEAVTVVGTRLVLNVGGVTRYAVYNSGSTTTQITYRYTVQSGDKDNDGILISLSQIDLDGGTIKNAAGTNANVSFTPPNYTDAFVNRDEFAGGSGNSIYDVALANDGSNDIYLAGSFQTYGGSTANRIIRLNSDLTRDSAFTAGCDNSVHQVVPAEDGSGDVYLSGYMTNCASTSIGRILRLNSDGTVDSAFNTGTGFDASAYLMIAANDGSGDIFVSGDFTTYNGSALGFTNKGAVRLGSDGTLKATFDSVDVSPNYIAYDKDNNSFYIVGSGIGPRIRKFNATTGAGVVISGSLNATAFSVILAPGGLGDILVGGAFTTYDGNTAERMVRIDTAGAYDSLLNTNPGFNGTVDRIFPAENGANDVYVTGTYSTYKGSAVNSLIRLDETGTFMSNLGNFDNTVEKIVTTNGGNTLYIVGRFDNFNGIPTESFKRIRLD